MAKVTITKNTYKATNEKSADDIKAEITKANVAVKANQTDLAKAIMGGSPQADIVALMAKVTDQGTLANQLERDLSSPLMTEAAREVLSFAGDKMFNLAKASPSAYAEMGYWTIEQTVVDGQPVLLVQIKNPNVSNSRAHIMAEIKPDSSGK